MQRRGRRFGGWMLSALALGVVVPSACGGRAMLDDPLDGGLDDDAGGAARGGARTLPSMGGASGAGGARGGSAGRAGFGGSTLAGAGGSAVSGAAGSALSGTGGAAGSAMAGAAGSATDEPPVLAGCSSSNPLDGGFARCENGLLHRPLAGAACPSRLPRERAFAPDVFVELEQLAREAGYAEPEISSLYVCREDTDCTEQANGYCELAAPVGWSLGAPFTACRYACSSDVDCGGGTLCQCGEPGGQCVSATCFEDSECGAGLLCAPYDALPGCNAQPVWLWECQRLADECSVDADCQADQVCLFVGSRRACSAPICG